jgi:hypothetical protein
MSHGALVYGRLRDLGRSITRRKVSGKVVRERVHSYRFELVKRSRGGSTRRLKGGPDNVAAVQYPAQIGDYGAGVTSLAFDGKRVAYTWTGPDQHNCPIDDFDRGGSSPVAGTVYVESGGRRQALDRGCDMGSRGTVGSVSITPTGVRWLRAGGPKTLVGTQPFGGRPSLAQVPLPQGTRVVSTSADATAQWYTTYDGSRSQLYRLPN